MPGAAFAIKYFEAAGYEQSSLLRWFKALGESTRRHRLNGWRDWHYFCTERGYAVSDTRAVLNPSSTILAFVDWLDDMGVPEYAVRGAVVAVKELMSLLRSDVASFCDGNGILKTTLASLAKGVRRISKFRKMWRLEILLRHIKDGPPVADLSYRDLMARAAAVFMVFVPCRPVTMLRINPAREIWAKDGQSVEIPAKEKMDKGQRETALVIRKGSCKELCPLTLYLRLKDMAASNGLVTSLWGYDRGKPYKTSSGICRLLKQLLSQAGVPEEYTAYSIRHATITALFEAGLSELQVNAFTGHSNNSHTAASSYLHLDRLWMGDKLSATATAAATATERQASEGAVKAILKDNTENLSEEQILEEYINSDPFEGLNESE